MLLKEIQLTANHVNELFIFYEELMQLPVEKTANAIEIIIGDSKIIFKEAEIHQHPYYHFAINIPSNKIEEALLWLQSKTELVYLNDYKSYIADFKNWHAKSVYFIDPAENIVELIARFDLNDNVTEKFSSEHFRSISEIGIVFPVENFDTSIEKLLAETELTYFEKQPALPQFRAIGDNHGLFIAVTEHRTWYGSNGRQAGLFPMKIIFDNDGMTKEISF
ncbi:MAG TPA: hypothetical protein PL045_00735 [Chitinophagaceae bacterium]|nr:hypothetical protein [Chitinophagaceae bacterium]